MQSEVIRRRGSGQRTQRLSHCWLVVSVLSVSVCVAVWLESVQGGMIE